MIEITDQAVYLQGLVDIGGNHSVVIPLLIPVFIIAECAFVTKEKSTLDIAFNRWWIMNVSGGKA